MFVVGMVNVRRIFIFVGMLNMWRRYLIESFTVRREPLEGFRAKVLV